MAQVNFNSLLQEQIAKNAASKYHIPFSVLWGVYGVETSHGSNVTTSSTGAKGPFQFEPETARAYHAPYSDAIDVAGFQGQAEAAAHYLSDLYKQHGSWDAALHAYSGGGYGWTQVAKQGAQRPGNEPGPLGQAAGAVKSAAEAPIKAGEAAVEGVEGIAGLVKVLVDPNTWLRVAEGVGGMVLVFMGLKTLTRGSGTAGPLGEAARQVRSGTGVVKKAAEVAAVAVPK
jgi:hypothetical protein